MVKKFFPVVICVFFAIVAGVPLLHSGLPPTHDGEYHVVRFFEFDKALKAGSWYPRWASDLNNGFGVPLFNYVYPLPNYIASLIHSFNVSFIDTFKLEMFLAGIVGGLFFYLWSREFWGKTGGVVSSVFYTFAPYHFVDIYVRGSVGEVWALALFPAFLWSITNALKDKRNSFIPLSSILLALIIFSHNILALMFLPFSLSYALLLILMSKDKTLLFKSCIIFILGIGLASIFWLPALFEKSYVKGLEVFSVENNFPEIYQLIFPSWGSGFSEDLASGLSVQIGPMHLLSVFIVIIFAFFYKKIKDKKSILLFFLGWFFLVAFLMNRASLPLWQKFPLMNFFQFPWRFLSLEILIASFCTGSIFVFKKRIILAVIFIGLVFTLGISYTKPAYYLYRNDSYYTTRSNFINGTNSPGNSFNTMWMKDVPPKQTQRILFEKDTGTIRERSIKETDYRFEISSRRDSRMLINTAYFPGWNVQVDRKNVPIRLTQDGRISFVMPSGTHRVEVAFEETSIRKAATLTSLAALLILIALFKQAYFVTIKR